MIKEILILQKNIILNIKTVVRPEDEDDKFIVKKKHIQDPGVLINSEFLKWT